MTQFDYIAIGVLLLSAGAGFIRGAAHEMVTVVAFVAAAVAALFGLRFSGPAARAMIDPDWAGNVAAVVVVFVGAYIVLRFLGLRLARRIRAGEVMGMLDRSVGVGFGLVRAVILLGAFNLFFNAATPPERVPEWISGAKLYPLSAAAGNALTRLAPQGMGLAGKLQPALGDAVRDGVSDSGRDSGYDAQERGRIDDLVEKSR